MTSTPSAQLVLVSVGNTRTRFAAVEGGGTDLEPSTVLENSRGEGAVAEAVRALCGPGATVLLASVNPGFTDGLERAIEAGDGPRVVRFGRDVPIPMPTAVEAPEKVGQDRLLDALGAFGRSKQACIVIDAGTAITVDFVDGEGTFQGGAIAPGLGMMLRAMHDQTAQLPAVEVPREAAPARSEVPGEGPPPFGKNTKDAMLAGARAAAKGLVRELVDAYAEFYGAYPRVVATGGDAPMLFQHDGLVEHIVPDLTLVGMLEAATRLDSLEEAGDDDDLDEDGSER